ncbi:MAG: 6-carboxytetrahydropterin synthase [Spirochaetia bacterium]|nr:6-carboxytetrahydropterin synthase [Spirochaetia bacterium]
MPKFKYEIRIDGMFESAHFLYDYFGPGKNEPVHGHTYQVELFIGSNKLRNGISVDFLEVRVEFDKLMIELDHICLNTRAPFTEMSPTAENIAEHVFNYIKGYVRDDARITQVKVWEGPKNSASFFPDE